MTTYNSTARNSTTFNQALSTGNLTYLLTDALDYILVGSAEDETLILWDATEFTQGTRQTTTFNSVASN